MNTTQDLTGNYTYFRGDKATFTGESETIHGGKFYKVQFTEGHKKDNFAWVSLDGPNKCSIHGPQTITTKGQTK